MEARARHVLSHAGIYFLARGLPGLLSFLAIAAFTRLLEPAEYGRYALVVATAMLVNALLFQWLRLALVRYLAVYHNDETRLKSTLAALACLLILACALIAAVLYIAPIAPSWRELIIPCWALLSLHSLFELCTEFTRARLRPWQYMSLQLLRTFVTVALGIGLVLMGMGWRGPLLGMIGGIGLATIFACLRDWTDIRPRIDRRVLAQVSWYGVPLSLTVALTVVISCCDRFIVAALMGEDAAGLYSVAMDLTTQTLTLIMMVISMASFPMAVRAWEHSGPDAARDHMRSNAAMLLAIGVPCVVGLTVLAPGIAYCFLGADFRDAAADIMPLVAIGAFLAGLKAYHFDTAFQFAHRTIGQIWIVLFAAVVNIAANFAAIPLLGLRGAALSSVAAYAISIALTIWLGRRHFVLPFPWWTALQVTCASGVMAGVLYPLREHQGPTALAAQVLGGVAVYGGLLVAMNVHGLRNLLWMKLAAQRSGEGRSAHAVAPAVGLVETP